jgi:ribosomal protein S6--L-glutamate ligase
MLNSLPQQAVFIQVKNLFFHQVIYKTTCVTNSFGHREKRYKVKLRINLNGKLIRGTFTLSSNRGIHRYKVLIGRKLLKGKFLVDVRQGGVIMRIAILSNGNGNYSTKRLKEEAIKRGHEVKIIRYRDCYASIEQNHPTVSYRGEDLAGFDAVIPRIASYMTKYGTAIVRQLEMQGMYTASSSIAIVRSRDKLRTLQYWQRMVLVFQKPLYHATQPISMIY